MGQIFLRGFAFRVRGCLLQRGLGSGNAFLGTADPLALAVTHQSFRALDLVKGRLRRSHLRLGFDHRLAGGLKRGFLRLAQPRQGRGDLCL